ncbi:hypothetical protein [Methylocystis sp. S23]|jgi:hypothetical protein
MRSYILASCMMAAFAPPVAAAPSDPAPEARIQQITHRDYNRGRWGYGADCRELRRACLYKEDLGEQGRGNCRRYRELCR